jgi:hypothetical protein
MENQNSASKLYSDTDGRCGNMQAGSADDRFEVTVEFETFC